MGGSAIGEVLANVTAASTGGSTVAFGNLAFDTANSTTDLAMTVAISASDVSTTTFTGFDNQYGSISATLTSDSSSFINFGSITTTDEITAVSATINAEASVGTNVINASLVTTSTITLGTATGTDTIVVGAGKVTTITGFEAGASGDVIGIDLTQYGTLVNGAVADVAAANAVDIEELSGAETTTGALKDNVLVLTGEIYATASLAEAAIEASGSRALTTGTTTTGDDLLIAWSDGSDSYLGHYNISTGGTSAIGDLVTMVELIGVNVSTSGTLVNGNFDFV